MTHDNALALCNILGFHGTEVVEVKEDSDWEVCLARPGGKVVALDHCGAYLFADRRTYDRFRIGEDFEVSPVLDAVEWADFGDEANAAMLGKILGGDPYHSGGNNWHTIVIRLDGRAIVFCEEGVLVAPTLDAWHDSDDTESWPWLDYTDLNRTATRTPDPIRADDLDWDAIVACVAKDGNCQLCDELTEVPARELEIARQEAARRFLTLSIDFDGIWVANR